MKYDQHTYIFATIIIMAIKYMLNIKKVGTADVLESTHGRQTAGVR